MIEKINHIGIAVNWLSQKPPPLDKGEGGDVTFFYVDRKITKF